MDFLNGLSHHNTMSSIHHGAKERFLGLHHAVSTQNVVKEKPILSNATVETTPKQNRSSSKRPNEVGIGPQHPK